MILGDFNIDMQCKRNNPNRDKLNAFCTENDMVQLIEVPTRFGPTNSTTIDLILTDAKYRHQHGTVNYNVSDHLPIYLSIKKPKETYTKVSFSGRSYALYDKVLFQSNLTKINWGRYYGTFDVDEAWDILYTAILNECDRQCPIKEFKIRRNRPVWFSDEITELSCNRDELNSIGRGLNKLNMLREARSLRNLVKSCLTNAKNSYYLNQMTIHKEDQKKFWNHMHELINKKIWVPH